jgi:hypothetical protein
LAPFYAKTPSFYQDRLGTNIGKALQKRRDAFPAGPQDVSVAWTDLPKGILGDHCPPAGCAVRDIFTQKDLAPSATVRKIQNDLFCSTVFLLLKNDYRLPRQARDKL